MPADSHESTVDAINAIVYAYQENPEDWCCLAHALWEELPAEVLERWLTESTHD